MKLRRGGAQSSLVRLRNMLRERGLDELAVEIEGAMFDVESIRIQMGLRRSFPSLIFAEGGEIEGQE